MARLFLRWSLLWLVFSLAALVGRASTPFEAAQTEAEGLRKEGSWALAAAAYQKAIPLAVTEADRQAATLAKLEMGWRAAQPLPWQEREAFTKTWNERLLEVGAAYGSGRPRDDFWLEWQLARLEFQVQFGSEDRPARGEDLLDFLGSLPRTPEATARAVRTLQRLERLAPSQAEGFAQKYRALLIPLRTAPASNDDRAWLLTSLARGEAQAWADAAMPVAGAAKMAVAWQEARVAARGTVWEASTALEALLWLNTFAPTVQGRPLRPDELPALVAEGDRWAAACAPDADTENLRQRWQQLRDQWQTSQWRVEAAEQALPGEPLRFTFGSLGFKRVQVEVVRLKPEDYLNYEQRRLLNRTHASMLVGETVWSRSHEDGQDEKGEWSTGSWVLAEGLPGGLYQVRWRGEKKAAGLVETKTSELWITRWSLQRVQAGQDTGILITDTKTGEPLRGMSVVLGWRGKHQGGQISVTTNDVGFAAFAVEPTEAPLLLAGWKGEEPLAGLARFWRPDMSQRERPVGELLLDRPLYEPGETVHWRLLVREGEPGAWRLPTLKDDVEVEFRTNRDEVLWSGAVRWSEFGTLAGSFTLDSKLSPTAAHLSVRRQGEGDGWLDLHHCFQVDRFEPPAVTATLELLSASDTLAPGRLAQFGLKVKYFSGSPVVGTPVEFKVWPSAPYEPRFDGRAVSPSFLTEWPERTWRAVTDQEGVARLELPLPAEMAAGTRLTLSGQALANSGTAVEGRQDFLVYPRGKYIKAAGLEEMSTARLGDAITLETVIRQGDGQPAPGAYEAALERLRWNEVWRNREGRVVDGAAAAEGRKQDPALVGWELLHAAYHATEVARQTVTSDAEGKVRVTWNPVQEGLYQMVLRDGGHSLEGERVYRFPQPLDLFPATKGDGAVESHRPLAMVLGDGDQLDLPAGAVWLPKVTPTRAGEKPRDGFALLPLLDEPTWLILNRGQGLETLPWQRKGRVAQFQLPETPAVAWPEEWSLAMQVGTTQSTGRQQSFTLTSSYPDLSVQMTPKGDVARPGDMAEAELQVLDREGRPVRAEVALAVADQAVRELAGQRDGDDETFIYYQPVRRIPPRIEIHPVASRAVPEQFPDPRPGFGSGSPVDERIELSAFSVGSTLAGARIKMSTFDRGDTLESGAMASQPRSVSEEGASPTAARVRVNYQSTAWWASSLRTDENGRARVSFRWPDNLTRWHWQAEAVGAAPQAFGRVQTSTRTDLPLQARLRVPEVLIAGDRVDLSGTLVNQAETAVTASTEWEISGDIHKMDTNAKRQVDVPARAEASTTHTVTVVAPGTLDVTLRAAAASEGDAMRRTTTVREDGLLQKTFASFALPAGKKRASAALALPQPLDRDRAEVSIRVDPLGVGSLVEAIPFLVHYPYGCVEQTLNRFLPAVAVRGFLTQQGLAAEKVQKRWMGASADGEKAKTLDEVIDGGLARLEAAMVGGGYGWWPDAPTIDPWMTAYVAWGLQEARRLGVRIDANWLERTEDAARGVAEANERNSNAVAWALVALASSERTDLPTDKLRERWQSLYARRAEQPPSTRALLLWSADRFGSADAKAVLLRNLENGATRTDALGLPLCSWQGVQAWCRAEDGAVETTAITLFALLAAAPSDERVHAAAHWLLLNRRGAQWDSTRSTALAVLALQRWLATRQTEPLHETVELWAEGTRLAEFTLTAEQQLEGAAEVKVPVALLKAGGVKVEVRRKAGNAPLVITAAGRAWATGDGVKPFAQVLGVERVWRRLESSETLRGDLLIKPRDLAGQEAVRIGEGLQGRVALQTEVALPYLKIEVPLAGGTTPAALLSGWDARLERADGTGGDGFPVYREAHPGKSVFFLPELPVGNWVLVFDLRADLGGDFRTLPAEAEAMYVPEVRGNSDSRRLLVKP